MSHIQVKAYFAIDKVRRYFTVCRRTALTPSPSPSRGEGSRSLPGEECPPLSRSGRGGWGVRAVRDCHVKLGILKPCHTAKLALCGAARRGLQAPAGGTAQGDFCGMTRFQNAQFYMTVSRSPHPPAPSPRGRGGVFRTRTGSTPLSLGRGAGGEGRRVTLHQPNPPVNLLARLPCEMLQFHLFLPVLRKTADG